MNSKMSEGGKFREGTAGELPRWVLKNTKVPGCWFLDLGSMSTWRDQAWTVSYHVYVLFLTCRCQNSQVVWFIIAAPRLVQRNKEQTTARKGYDKLGCRERREMGNSRIHSLGIILGVPAVTSRWWEGGAVVFAAVNGDGDGDGDGHRAVPVAW